MIINLSSRISGRIQSSSSIDSSFKNFNSCLVSNSSLIIHEVGTQTTLKNSILITLHGRSTPTLINKLALGGIICIICYIFQLRKRIILLLEGRPLIGSWSSVLELSLFDWLILRVYLEYRSFKFIWQRKLWIRITVLIIYIRQSHFTAINRRIHDTLIDVLIIYMILSFYRPRASLGWLMHVGKYLSALLLLSLTLILHYHSSLSHLKPIWQIQTLILWLNSDIHFSLIVHLPLMRVPQILHLSIEHFWCPPFA